MITPTTTFETLESRTFLSIGPAPVGDGLQASYYANQFLAGTPVTTEVDATVGFSWGRNSPAAGVPKDGFSARWTGQLQPATSENYAIYTQSDDGVRLWVNNQLVIDNWSSHSLTEDSATVPLAAGERYDLKMEFFEKKGQATAKLLWSSPSVAKQVIPQEQLFSSTQVTAPLPVGQAPTSLTLSYTSTSPNGVAENQPAGTLVGTFTTTDPDPGDVFTYSFASGTGDTDNAAFSIVGNQLLTNASFNYEAKSSYSVRVRSSDQSGLFLEQMLTVVVTNVNEAPAGVTLSNSSVTEKQPAGTAVGTLATVDPDAGDGFAYSLVSGTGSTDNTAFSLVNGQLVTNAAFDSTTQSSYSVRVRATDAGGLFAEQAFTIAVLAANTAPSTDPTAIYLTPGTGFRGATTQPAAMGTAGQAGYDAKAMARWDVVPFQTFDNNFNVGVIAFHMNDIDRVEFSVNGGTWTAVRTMTNNPQTGVFEYTATLRASDFKDGQVEVRAIAYPKVGVPRVLQGTTPNANGEESLLLTSNANHTLASVAAYVATTGSDTTGNGSSESPFATITKAVDALNTAAGLDGGTIFLRAGSYTFDNLTWPVSAATNSTRWLTITTAPGVARDQVHLRAGASGSSVGSLKLVRVQNLSIDAVTGGPVVYSSAATARAWWDTCVIDGKDRTLATANGTFGYTTDWLGGKYITDSIARELNGSPGGTMVRGTTIVGTLSGGPWNTPLVVNTTIADVNPLSTGAHPDVWRTQNSMENVILYNMTTPVWDQQGSSLGLILFRGNGDVTFNYKDIAIVGANISAGSGVGEAFCVGGNLQHVFVKDSNFRGGTNNYIQSASDFVIENTTWQDYNTGALVSKPVFPGVTYR